MTLYEAVLALDAAAVEAALATGPDVDALGPGRRTPLIEAAKAGRVDLVRRLLEAGAAADWRDDEGETALLKAAAWGHRDVVALLEGEASDDERDLARAFLAASGMTLDAPPAPKSPVESGQSGLKRRAVEAVARAADFVGYGEPVRRVERVERAETDDEE